MDAEQFFTEAMEPGFPNEMAFQLTASNPDPERSFSHEGIQQLADNFHDFLLARTKGVWDATGQAPKSLFAKVVLTIGEKPLSPDQLELFGPWTSWEDTDGGLATIDATMRAGYRESLPGYMQSDYDDLVSDS